MLAHTLVILLSFPDSICFPARKFPTW